MNTYFKYLTITLSLCTPLTFAAQKPVTIRPLPAFTNINISGNSKLTVEVGKPQQILIHGKQAAANCIITDVNSDTLYIHQLSKKLCQTTPPITLTINIPKLNTISTQGNNNTTVTNLKNRTFLTYSSGRSHLSLNGSSRSLNSILSGESSVDAHNFKTGGIEVTASGNSQMQLQTTGTLFVRASGNATVTYSGKPKKLIKSLSGNSSLDAG